MKERVSSFDRGIYERCKKELNTGKVRGIVSGYRKRLKLGREYVPGFLSYYYSPLLAALKQFLDGLKGKRVLEVGYRVPMFLDYLESKGAIVHGVDAEPLVEGENLLKASVERLSPRFLKENEGLFDAVVERITLSRLYD